LEQVGVYTVNLWMPALFNTFLHAPGPEAAAHIARIGALPYLAAAICTVLVGWSSDRTGERRFHIAGTFLVGAAGFAWAAYAHSLMAVFFAMVLAAVGFWSMTGPFWALPTRVLGGRAAAGGVAIITMVGSVGGFMGPALTGKLKDMTHTFTAGLLVIAGVAVAGAVLCCFLPPAERPGQASEDRLP
jgi:ACS family tartrate transporter-like MFS transporter